MKLTLPWGGLYAILSDKEDFSLDILSDEQKKLFLRLKEIEETPYYRTIWKIVSEFTERDINYLSSPFLDELRKRSLKVDVSVLRFLAERGARIYRRNALLRWAFDNGKVETIKFLKEKRVNVKMAENYLADSIYNDHVELVKFYLDNGSMLEHSYLQFVSSREMFSLFRDHLSHLPFFISNLLHNGCRRGDRLFIDQILKMSKTPHYHRQLVFQYLVLFNQIDLVNQFIEFSVVSEEDIVCASRNGHLQVLQLLLERSSYIQEHVLSEILKTDSFPVLEFLVKKYNPSIRLLNYTITFAITQGNLEIVKFLLSKGVKIDKDTTYFSFDFEMVKFLVEHEVNDSSIKKSFTIACINGNTRILNYLRKKVGYVLVPNTCSRYFPRVTLKFLGRPV